LEPHLSEDVEPEVRGFCFVWKGVGRKKDSYGMVGHGTGEWPSGEGGSAGFNNAFEGGEAWDVSQYMNKFTIYTSRTQKIEHVREITRRGKKNGTGSK